MAQFTVGELHALVRFYSSPDGRGVLAKIGGFTRDLEREVTVAVDAELRASAPPGLNAGVPPVSRLCPLLRAALPAELVVVLETAETPLHSPRAVRAHDGWFRQIRLETPTWLTAEGERTEDLRHGRDADRREGHCQPCVEGSAILELYQGLVRRRAERRISA